MKIGFHSMFFKSLKRLKRRQTWWYKTYEFFKYDIWRFFRNVRKFRKELYGFYPWDFIYNLRLLKRSLELTCENIEKYGNEVPESKNKKVAKMKRVIELIEHISNDDFIDQAEKQLGKEVIRPEWNFEKTDDELYMLKEDPEEVRTNNSQIFNLADEIEEKQWKELFSILQGQDKNDFKPSDTNDREKMRQEYEEWFDGSGMKTWWD